MSKRHNLIFSREKKGWNQDELGIMLDITQQYISLIENGKRDPSTILAKKFEIIFETPMEELFPDMFENLITTKCNESKYV